MGWSRHSGEGSDSHRPCRAGICQEEILQQCSRVCEWAGTVAISGKAENELAWSGYGFGVYYTGNGEPVIKGTEAEG